MKKFWEDEDGETNLVSIIIIVFVIIVALVLFKPYILKLILWIKSCLV